jgi:hypothetical protein
LAAADPVFRNGTSKGVPAVDVGLGWDLDSGRTFRVGLAARNLNQPDWGLATTDRIMMEAQFGLAWQPVDWGFTLIGDLGWQNVDSGEMNEPLVPALGIEKTLADGNFALRLGVTPLEATGGFGIKWQGWSLDYAVNFKFNLLTDNLGSHQIGLTYTFGNPSRAEATAVGAPAGTLPPQPETIIVPATPAGAPQPGAKPTWVKPAPAPVVTSGGQGGTTVKAAAAKSKAKLSAKRTVKKKHVKTKKKKKKKKKPAVDQDTISTE